MGVGRQSLSMEYIRLKRSPILYSGMKRFINNYSDNSLRTYVMVCVLWSFVMTAVHTASDGYVYDAALLQNYRTNTTSYITRHEHMNDL